MPAQIVPQGFFLGYSDQKRYVIAHYRAAQAEVRALLDGQELLGYAHYGTQAHSDLVGRQTGGARALGCFGPWHRHTRMEDGSTTYRRIGLDNRTWVISPIFKL